MFGLFASQEKKMRANADNWLELADRVWQYRRDQLSEAERKDLLARTDALRQGCRDRANAGKLKVLIEQLEGVLRRTGGKIYPKSALIENVEFFLVAAIVILGIRTYFVQPFKIPTNSMWPSYYGMTPEVYQRPEDAPGLLARAMRFVLLGAVHHDVIAPESGLITVPVATGPVSGGGGKLIAGTKPARSWLVFPTTNREYIIYVNETPVAVQLPQDFDFDWAFREAFGLSVAQLAEAAAKAPRRGGNFSWVTLDRRAVQGKPLLSFDILTGDQLFVDRLSYHFFRPQVGQGFVFRTGNIPGIARAYGDQYYIKRLVGIPGDALELRQPVLWRNGQPITGADAFDKNARRADRYRGYFNGVAANGALFLLTADEKLTVPAESFFAMGDNSGNSADGRYWGFVPAKDAAGKPLFIYYPFTRHWGLAR
ncbi:MAG: signal peptidase I [Opitutaceae bacterium]|nr:signal peptidase I [Opitutaceae bacterium]